MSTSVDPIRALERSPLFRGIALPVLHSISMFSEARALRAGEVLAAAGRPAIAAWLVAAGALRAEPLIEGKRTLTDGPATDPGATNFGVGMLVGHLDLLNNAPSGATWVAPIPGAVLVFEAGPFQQLISDDGAAGSAFRRALILSLSEQLRAANLRVSDYVAHNPSAARPSKGLLREVSGLLGGTRVPPGTDEGSAKKK